MVQLDGSTKLLGVVGYPVSHSLSPLMHNAAFEYLGINYCYLALPVAPRELAEAVKGLRALGFAGFNVTIPHKEAIIPLLDEVDPEALNIGAVNTVVNENGKLVGYNTDGRGFLQGVKELWGYSPLDQEAVILGAGGAARAIAATLAAKGAKGITLANRDINRAQKLAAELGDIYSSRFDPLDLAASKLDLALEKASLVIQTTPVGMHPNTGAEPVINPKRLFSHNLVYDIIFNPWETRFLSGAKEQGCRVANGIGMLLYQGTLAFELWTKHEAPVKIMGDTLIMHSGSE